METMKKQKKFFRHIYVEDCYDFSQAASVFNELGYKVYDDPSSDGDCYIISNQKMTYGDFIEFYNKELMDLMEDNDTWAQDAFGDISTKELDEVK